MKKNRQFEYDDDLEMIDLLYDHFESAQKGIRDSARKEEKRKADKKKDDKAVRIMTVRFIVSLCFSAFLVFLVERGKSRLKEEKAARAEEQKRHEQELEADWIEIDRLKSEMFTEQQLEERVAQRLGDIEEKAADEREDAVRQIMREAALKEGGGPMTAVRAVFDDEVFFAADLSAALFNEKHRDLGVMLFVEFEHVLKVDVVNRVGIGHDKVFFVTAPDKA